MNCYGSGGEVRAKTINGDDECGWFIYGRRLFIGSEGRRGERWCVRARVCDLGKWLEGGG